MRQYLTCVNVHYRQLILILEIDVYLAGIISSKELRFAAQLDRRIDLPVDRVDVRLQRHQHTTVARYDKH